MKASFFSKSLVLSPGIFLFIITTNRVVYSQGKDQLLLEVAIPSQKEGKNFQPSFASLQESTPSLLSEWWNGVSALGSWFGLRDQLSDHGFTITGFAESTYFGQLSGGFPNQQKSNFINEEKLNALLNIGQFLGFDSLDGLTFSSTWRYRNDGNNPGFVAGNASGPSSIFNPSTQTSGLGVRILPQYFEYSTRNKAFTINLGWENPYDQFLQQPLSKFFEDNAITSAKGIGGTAGPGIPVVNPAATFNKNGTPATGAVQFYKTSPVPWGSSYAAWGGTLKVKPTRDTYIQSGLYAAISGENGVSSTQFTATSVYPYTQVPRSYLGQLQSAGLVYQAVGANGKPLYDSKGQPVFKVIGYVPGYNQNHGFNFQGSPAFNPQVSAIGYPTSYPGSVNPPNYGSGGQYSQNGLYNVNEIGWTPKFGRQKLEGHYALGGYLWGQENTDWTPTQYTASTLTPTNSAYTSYAAKKQQPFQENQVIWGLYLQADQQLYRAKSESENDSFSQGGAPETTAKAARLSEKGLYLFSEFSFTPPQNNALPYYFQTGLVYKGLLPHRDHDTTGIALGAGFYSSYYNQYIQNQNQSLVKALGSANNSTVPNGPTSSGTPTTQSGSGYTFYGAYQPAFSSTEVVEAFYNIQVNKWAAIKPFAQFIANPAGNGTVANDWILGVSAKVTF